MTQSDQRHTEIAQMEKDLRHIAGIIKQQGRKILTNYKITPPQFIALQWLFELGDMTIGDLSTKMYLAFSTTTDLVDRMEKNELVKRVRDEQDRRVVRIHLLPEGERIIEEVIEKEIVAVKSVNEADIVIPEKKEVIKEIKKVEKIEPVKQKVVQKPVVKPQPKVQTQNIAKNSAQQKMKGGKPLVSSSSIKFIKNPAPKRPRIAHRNKWTGNSVVMVEIDQRGNPVKVVLERSSGHDVLDKAALEAARGVKIHPYIENGQTLAIRHRMDYAF